MTPARCLSRLRLCLAILPVLALLAGTWAEAAMPVPGQATVVICSGGTMKTVRVGEIGAPESLSPSASLPASMLDDCRDCPACILPPGLGFAAQFQPLRPAHRACAVRPHLAARPVPPRPALARPSRGPPSQIIRHQA